MEIKTIEDLVKHIRSEVGDAVADAMEKNREAGIQRRHTASLAGDVASSGGIPPDDDPANEAEPTQPGYKFARCVRYLASCKGIAPLAADMAEKDGCKWAAKALGESTMAGGGALLPEGFSNEIIELLTPKTLVRKAGVTTMPMNEGSLGIPYIGTGSTAAYVGENQVATKSEPTFGQLQLADKKLVALVPISNDLIRSSSGKADRVVRDDLVRAMSIKEDITFIRSEGVNGEPKGMRYWAEAANVFATAGTTLAQVTTDATTALQKLEDNDVPLEGVWSLMAPRTRWFLMAIRDGNGNYAFKDEMSAGTYFGLPFGVTSQIPTNLSTNQSELYFANMPILVLAENERIMIDVFDGGTYYDNSALVSGISTDQTVMRAIALHDFGARQRGKEIAVVTGITYGV